MIHPIHVEWIDNVYRIVVHPCGLGSSGGNPYQFHHYIDILCKNVPKADGKTNTYMYLLSKLGGNTFKPHKIN